MRFRLVFTTRAAQDLHALEFNDDKRDPVKLKKVRRCLALLEADPRHPGLETHEYQSMKGRCGERVWEAYVESNTPAAWRVFWHYGPDQGTITVIAITRHP